MQAYRLKAEFDAQAEEERVRYDHEKALNEYFIRLEPLGTDRHGRTYYSFQEDGRLYVEEWVAGVETAASETAAYDSARSSRCTTPVPVRSTDRLSTPTYQSEAEREHVETTLRRMEELRQVTSAAWNTLSSSNKPSTCRSFWYVYATPRDIWRVYDALDERGERERALKSAIKSTFNLDEPPLQFLSEGNEFIGKIIRRTFGRNKVSVSVVCWWFSLCDAGRRGLCWR